jgi:glycosyltransferase involved in cell wall biosynthesis
MPFPLPDSSSELLSLRTTEPASALCHEWVTTYGGSEQVSGRIVRALGIGDVFTFAADPELVRAIFPAKTIRVHELRRTSAARRHWQWFLPLMPKAWGRLDLGRFDVVITSSHACTNAISVRPGAYHLSYCHSPMRYAWDWKLELKRFPPPARPLWPLAARTFRRLDRGWARRVTLFMANSRHVADRIRRYYGRSSVVIHPPIETGFWAAGPDAGREDFFLFAGRLVPYKRADVAVAAAAMAGVRLVVTGSGPELPRLKRQATPNVEFVTDPTNEELRDLYGRARALVFPGIEDFGMTMVEAQACGTPVIAFGEGGAREIVRPGITGVLYSDPTPEGLAGALRAFDPGAYSTEEMRRHATRFDAGRFDTEIRKVVDAVTRESVGVASTDDFAERLQQDLHVDGQ